MKPGLRASDAVLARMVMLQTLTVGLIGYGCGVGLATLFGVLVLKKGMPPFFLPWQLPLLTLGAHSPGSSKSQPARHVFAVAVR